MIRMAVEVLWMLFMTTVAISFVAMLGWYAGG